MHQTVEGHEALVDVAAALPALQVDYNDIKWEVVRLYLNDEVISQVFLIFAVLQIYIRS